MHDEVGLSETPAAAGRVVHPSSMSRHPDLTAALDALHIDPDDPADREDFEAVEDLWSRRTLAPLFDPLRRHDPIAPANPPTLRAVRPPQD